MRELKFIINHQNIEKDLSCDFSNIVLGTSNYLFTTFSFSSEWNGFVKVAEFRVGISDKTVVPVPVVNNKCKVPSEVTIGRTWSVRIVGKKNDTILTTKSVRVQQERR